MSGYSTGHFPRYCAPRTPLSHSALERFGLIQCTCAICIGSYGSSPGEQQLRVSTTSNRHVNRFLKPYPYAAYVSPPRGYCPNHLQSVCARLPHGRLGVTLGQAETEACTIARAFKSLAKEMTGSKANRFHIMARFGTSATTLIELAPRWDAFPVVFSS